VCAATDRLDVLEEFARGTSIARVFHYLDLELARGALLGGRRIARELTRHFGDGRLEALPIPTAVVAADLLTGDEVALADGPIVESVLASMALPGLFRAIERDGRLLVDGGLVANLPLAAARALAPALPRVAVDLMGDYAGYTRALTPERARRQPAVGVVRTSFLMMIAHQAELQLALDPPDVLIRPPLGHIGTGAFHRAEELIEIGRAAAQAAVPAIHAAIAAQKTSSQA
jgi:NTE family protein